MSRLKIFLYHRFNRIKHLKSPLSEWIKCYNWIRWIEWRRQFGSNTNVQFMRWIFLSRRINWKVYRHDNGRVCVNRRRRRMFGHTGWRSRVIITVDAHFCWHRQLESCEAEANGRIIWRQKYQRHPVPSLSMDNRMRHQEETHLWSELQIWIVNSGTRADSY